jgi:hypothetical protein
MTITYLGRFTAYQPAPDDEQLGPALKAGAVFRRDERGRDFYLTKAERTVGALLVSVDDDNRVTFVGVGPDAFFPMDGERVYEIADADVSQLSLYAGKILNTSNGSFTDAPPPVPPSISRRQFYQCLAKPLYAMISEDDALAALSGALPPTLSAIVLTLPPDEQFDAKALLMGAAEFLRAHPLTNAIAAKLSWDDAKVDQFFRDAAAL